MSSEQPDSPFIIWTLRRTGGTSLGSLLFDVSPFPRWPDEAFNPDRKLGHITRAYQERPDLSRLDAEIAEVVRQKHNLKHCLETVPYQVTSSLLRQSTDAGYRHLMLLRRNEVERLLSLFLAAQTGAWGKKDAEARYEDVRAGRVQLKPIDPKMVHAQLNHDAVSLGRLMRLLLAHGIPFQQVFYEDLYSGTFEQRCALVDRLLAGLNLSHRRPDTQALYQRLMNSHQDSRSIHQFVPNLLEVQNIIRAFTE